LTQILHIAWDTDDVDQYVYSPFYIAFELTLSVLQRELLQLSRGQNLKNFSGRSTPLCKQITRAVPSRKNRRLLHFSQNTEKSTFGKFGAL
jgi:hypothetical protein